MYPFAPELRDPAQHLFTEIRPSWEYLGKSPHIIDLVALVAVFFTIVLLLRWRTVRGWEWALMIGLGGLALRANRGIGDWLFVTAAIAVPQIGPLFQSLGRLWRTHSIARLALKVDLALKKLFQGQLLRPQVGWPAAIFASLAILTVLPLKISMPNSEANYWPTDAVAWIEKGGLPGPGPWKIFSTSDDGAYLLWRLPEQARVYSDTRGFYYSGQMLMDSFYLPLADADWPNRLERVLSHGTEYFLVRGDWDFWKRLKSYAGAPLYQDRQFVIVSAEAVRSAAAKVQPALAELTK
jgi:hypothetical protein